MSKLFICFTVLQLKIASRIMDEEGDTPNTTLLYLGDRNLPRVGYMLKNMESRIQNTHYFNLLEESNNNKDSFVSKKISSLIKKWGYVDFDTIYLASIDMTFVGHLLSQIKFNTLVTFDDGTTNINKESIYYEKTSFWKKYFRYNYGRKYWVEDLRRLSSKHYTIYKEFPNIVPNPIYIPLFDTQPFEVSAEVRESSKIKILLGTVYSDICSEETDIKSIIDQLKRFVALEKIDLYIPHPRDNSNLGLSCDVVVPDIMTEKLIVQYLNKYKKIDLYGFSSSTQLNLNGIPNINNYVFISSKFNSATQASIDLFKGIAIEKTLDFIND